MNRRNSDDQHALCTPTKVMGTRTVGDRLIRRSSVSMGNEHVTSSSELLRKAHNLPYKLFADRNRQPDTVTNSDITRDFVRLETGDETSLDLNSYSILYIHYTYTNITP